MSLIWFKFPDVAIWINTPKVSIRGTLFLNCSQLLRRYGMVGTIQLTNFQSLIVFGEIQISPSCLQGPHIFQIYYYSQWGKWHFMKKLHFLQRLTFLLLHIDYRGIPLPFGIVTFGGCKTPTFQQACRCRCTFVKTTISMLLSPRYISRLYFTISYLINQLIEHEINKTLNWNFMFHVYVTSPTIPFHLKVLDMLWEKYTKYMYKESTSINLCNKWG